MESGIGSLEQGLSQVQAFTVTSALSTTPENGARGKNNYRPPGIGEEAKREKEIHEVICKLLRAAGSEGVLNVTKARGGRKYGPQLGFLLPPETLRKWLEKEDLYQVFDNSDGTWGFKFANATARPCLQGGGARQYQ